ncbi:MAG: hypothetical protein AB7S75_01050 [Desulfococcaceae bacterium]
MKNRQKRFVVKVMSILVLALLPAGAFGQTAEEITSTDVYYLAKSIDDSIVSLYQLTGKLSKKRISSNLRPRNVYMKEFIF